MDDMQWRQDLIDNPPRASKMFTPAEWKRMVLEEFIRRPNIFRGEKNGNFCGHPHDAEARKKISLNNSRYWKGKTGIMHPSTGRKRPDSIELARAMGISRRGQPAWNSGKTGLQTHSEETKKKMSLAKIGKPQEQIECPHCHCTGGKPAMARWHFDNCKEKK